MNRLAIIGLLALGIGSCTHGGHADKAESSSSRRPASEMQQPPLEFDEVWGPEQEAHAAEIRTTIESKVQKKIAEQGGIAKRDAHPKHHGCTTAFMDIDPSGLPPELRVGVFASAQRWPAWVRFSNGDGGGDRKDDIERDVRGMAVKVMNVPDSSRGSQDFVMITSERFFSKDSADYLELNRALTKSNKAFLLYLATHGTNRNIVLKARPKIAHTLSTTYHSSVPYKLGPSMMRFKAEPCTENPVTATLPKKPTSRFLRERLIETLKQRSACFDFYVQPNRQPDVQPAENPRIAWDVKNSPLIKVGRIEIPQQADVGSDARMNLCENMRFDPWNTVPETRPVGQINRIRLSVYPAISRTRHHANGITELEPTSHDACTGETAILCEARTR